MFGEATLDNVNNLGEVDVAKHLRREIAGGVALNFIDEPSGFKASETFIYHFCRDTSEGDNVLRGARTLAAVEAFSHDEEQRNRTGNVDITDFFIGRHRARVLVPTAVLHRVRHFSTEQDDNPSGVCPDGKNH